MERRGIFVLISLMIFLIGFSSAYEIVLDDGDSEFNSVGAWSNFVNACGYNGDYDYETDALINNTARWNPNITYAGDYEVYVHYCVHSARPNAVPFRVRDANGISTSLVDETLNASGDVSGDFSASGWKSIGIYRFNLTIDTPNQFVRLTTSSVGDTSADAVRFVLIESPTIDFVPLTETGFMNRNNFFVNVSVISSYLGNITLSLYDNLGGLVNSVISFTNNLQNQFVGLSDGTYFYNATAYDIIGNVNNTETRNITIDATSPVVTYANAFTEIDGANVSRDWIFTRFNYVEANFNSVSFSLSNSSSLVNSTLFTILRRNMNWTSLPNGIYFYNVTMVDGAGNSGFSPTRRITLDTTAPAIIINSPLNGNYSNKTLLVDFNAIDLLTLPYSWYYNGTENISYSSPVYQEFNEGSNTVLFYANDSLGNFNYTSTSFLIDTINPTIDFVIPTEIDGSYLNRDNILINVTSTDANLEIITIFLYDSVNNLINSVNATDPNYVNFSSLSDGVYYFNATAYDFSNNQNFTETRNVTIDTLFPQVNVVYPQNVSYTTNVTSLNYILTELNPFVCKYSLDEGTTNTTILCGENVTGLISNEGWNDWTVYISDLAGNLNSSSVSFFIDTIQPLIAIVSPLNNANFSTTRVDVNYTVSDLNLDKCWYTNNSGVDNNTFICGTNLTYDWEQGWNNVLIYANDSLGNINSSSISFYIDSIAPYFYNQNSLSCIYNYTDITISTEVSDYNFNSVGLSGNWENIWNNYSVSCTILNSTTQNCSYFVNSSYFENGESISWRWYALDNFGNNGQSAMNNFNLSLRTMMYVNLPDGLNGWYVTEPDINFSNPNAIRIFYEWNTYGRRTYNSSTIVFNLQDVNESLGIFNLSWWARNSCGNEKKQSQIFKIDLHEPSFSNLKPINGYSLLGPNIIISANVYDPFRNNSGINDSTIQLKLNGTIIPFNLSLEGTGLYKVLNGSLNLGDGDYTIELSAQDNAGRIGNVSWNFKINSSLLNFTIFSPIDGFWYNSSKIQVNITLPNNASIFEFRHSPFTEHKRVILCKNCGNYISDRLRYKNSRDNFNIFSFRAIDEFNNVVEKNVTIFVDSNHPIVTSTLPLAKRYFAINTGNFTVRYSESDLGDVILFYGNSSDLRNVVKTTCNSSTKASCNFDSIDLNDFNGQTINYWFELKDNASNVGSQKIDLEVDTSLPIINVNSPIQDNLYFRRALFNISLDDYVRTLEYKDNSALIPRWTSLCKNCDGYGNSELITRSFDLGNHNLTIRAVDYAGNDALKNVSFNVA